MKLGLGLSLWMSAAHPVVFSNGTFDTNTSPWALGLGVGTLTAIAGRGVVEVNDNFAVFYQRITTVIGVEYTVTGDIPASTGAPDFAAVRKADDTDVSVNVVTLFSGEGIALTGNFTATATSSYILLQLNKTAAPATASFDNLTVALA